MCSLDEHRKAYWSLCYHHSLARQQLHHMQQELDDVKHKTKSLATAHKARVTSLMNKRFKEQQSWVQQSDRYLKEEADVRFLYAEQLHNLANEIRTHYLNFTATDFPIKQEQA